MKKLNIYRVSLLVVSLFCLCLVIVVFVLVSKLNNDTVLLSATTSNNKNNALTMMLETDIDSNEYEVATSNAWPNDDYIFNNELSYCENGSKLIWNDVVKSVKITSNLSDKCFLYFDKYIYPKINEVSSEVTGNNITLNINASNGMGDIVSYYYSKDDGSSYVSSDTSTYTFDGLTANTTYNIKVYVTDSNNRKSDVYVVDVTTIYLISFNVSIHPAGYTVECTALPGMTWEEWIGSEYDTCNIAEIENGYVYHIETHPYKNHCPLVGINEATAATDEIIADQEYNHNGDASCQIY